MTSAPDRAAPAPDRIASDATASDRYWRARIAEPHDRVDLAPGVPRPDAPGPRARRTLPAAPGRPGPAGTLAAVAALLYRYTGTTDVVLGVGGLEVPAVRVAFTPDTTLDGLAAAVAADLAEARRHPAYRADVAYPVVVCGPAEPGAPARATGPGGPAHDGGGQGGAGGAGESVGELVVTDAWGGAPGLGYDPRLLPDGLVAALATDLARLLDGPTRVPVAELLPDPSYGAVAPVDPAERHAAGPVPPPLDTAALESTVAARFGATATRYPDRTAVLAADGELTYRELAARAGAVAAGLRGAGVGTGEPVGLLTAHGAGSVVGILGVLAAGGCYVPLDPGYPPARLAATAEAAGARVVLADAAHRPLAGELATGRVLTLEDLPPAPWPAACPAGPDDPAYLLFTSGSTGRPKAVVQNQRNVLYGALNHARTLRAGTADRMSVLSSFGFDMAVTDTFSALLTGAAAVPVDVRAVGLAGLAGALRSRGVTVYHSTPTVYRYLLDALGDGRLPAVRAVLLGGEEVVAADLRRCGRHFAPGCVFINGYGATEVSFAVQHHLRPGTGVDGVVPIGTPLPGMLVELRDAAGRPTALTGEITVTGRHVALGYWRDAERTADRFTDHGDGRRTYRTGDLARRRPDGTLCYLGRADRQVKIRGYRVELGEVEAALAELPGVARAVAVAYRPGGGEARLVGYLQAAPDGAPDLAGARTALSARLPHYLVPATLVPVETLPLTPTGKVDTAALPPPGTAVAPAGGAPSDAFPPAEPGSAGGSASARGRAGGEPTPATAGVPSGAAGAGAGTTAATVAAAWRAELGVDRIGPRQHFFDLGGHSLLLARVQQRLERELGRGIPLVELFEHPTIESLAVYLDASAGAGGDASAGGDAGVVPGAGGAPAVRSAAPGTARERAARRRTGLGRRRRAGAGADRAGVGAVEPAEAE